MCDVLIVYGSSEGQTRKIAARMAETVSEYGHTVTVMDAAAGPAKIPRGRHGAVIVAAPLHGGRHPAAVERFVRENLLALSRLPTAFFSVSLSAAGASPRQQANARRCAETFVHETGWRPGMVRLVAGALAYSRYGPVKRWMMKAIAWREGGSTDTSRDHEYTDWERLRGDVETFVTRAAPVVDTRREAVLATV